MENRIKNLRELIDQEFKELDKQKYSIPELSDDQIRDEADKNFPKSYQKKEWNKWFAFNKGAQWYREQLKK
jgi:hypothetical protein